MTRARELAELAAAYDSGGLSNMKNRIINGNMVIDQRNAGASITPTNGQYTIDRWQFQVSQASKLTAQRSTVAPAGFNNSLLVTSSSAYSVLTGDYFILNQYIEGFNFADMGWGAVGAATVTLSFWVRSSLTGTFGGALFNGAFNRSYPFSYTISAANTWEQKSITIAGDTAGTWVGATNGVGVGVTFGLGVGATYNGTAGAWTGSGLFSTTGATSVVGTNGATFYITGVQLEKGSTATSFDYRPYGTELQLCQRYWERIGYGSDIVIGGYQASGGTLYASFSHAVPKRATPTITKVGTWSVSNAGQPTLSGPTTWGFRAYISLTSTGSGYTINDSTSLYFTSESEL